MTSNNYFAFKRFIVYHDKCGMKVGTDGVLLGAWANGGKRILDIGCGSGLITLMMAQRFPESEIIAIDIDEDAFQQTIENVARSEFAERISIFQTSIQRFATQSEAENNKKYDSIVCNPPFFVNSLKSPDSKRSAARHAETLPFAELFAAVEKTMTDEGEFSVIIPTDYLGVFKAEASLHGLFLSRKYSLKTTAKKAAKRQLLSFSKQPPRKFDESEQTLLDNEGKKSEWYKGLTRDFYLDEK